MKKTKAKTVEHIRDKWLCHGCGICKAVCRQNAIEMVYDKQHRNYVPVVDEEKCVRCGLCVDICPGNELCFSEISKQFLDGEKYDILAGYYINNYIAWASDADIRRQAASGGVATAISKFLLMRKLVDKVIVVKSKENDPLRFEGTIISDEDDLHSAMGSKYCPVPLCSALKGLKPSDRTAVFGLPCHIHGIRKAQLQDKLFCKLDLILIGLFCGGTRGKEGTEWLIKKSGLESNKLANINYRGNGWPGQLIARFSDGNQLILPYPGYADLQFNASRPWRCKLCSDGLSELADLSVGDAWLKEISSENNHGVSIVISRSKKGEAILMGAMSAGLIESNIADDGDAVRSQRAMLSAKKYTIGANMTIAKMIGRGVPIYDNVGGKVSLSLVAHQLENELKCLLGRFTAKHNVTYHFLQSIRSFSKN